MGDTPSDAELVRGARDGSEDAFRRLLERHGPPLYRMLVRLTGQTADAEDLYQEATLRAARGLAGWREEGSFPAWLFTIARNLHLDGCRRRRADETPLTGDLPDPRPTSAGGGAAERELALALESLSPKLREVFLLRHYGERPFKEIAAILGLPLGTVLARMSYAVRELRPRLGRALALRMGEAS